MGQARSLFKRLDLQHGHEDDAIYDKDKPNSSAKAPSSPPIQTHVDRAISELRRGGLILLHGSAEESVLLVLAAEMANESGLATMIRLAGSIPSVIVPKIGRVILPET